MSLESYNLDKLIKVDLRVSIPNIWYSYRNKKTFLGIILQEEGFYLGGLVDIYQGKTLPDNLLWKGGKVYYKPKLILSFEGGIKTEYVFETEKEAKGFRDKIMRLSKGTFLTDDE